MMRNLKALGLLAFAALAMSAMFASAAQAQNGVLTTGHTEGAKESPEHTPATLLGTQYPDPDGASEEEVQEWEEWNFFEGEKGNEERIECDTATLRGESGGEETDIKVAPEYVHCRAQGSQDAIVTTNGCEYLLEQPATNANEDYEGGASLTCPGESVIEVDVYLSGNATNTSQFFQLCTIEIGPAEGSEEEGGHTVDPLDGHITYKNIAGDPDDITAAVTVEGINNDATGCGQGASETGTYTSTVTVEAVDAEDHETPIDAWISDE